MSLLAGVDAGASHSEVAVGDRSLSVLARKQGGPGALGRGETASVARSTAELVEGALLDAGSTAPAAALVVGAAGAGRESERKALESALRETGIASKVQVTTDASLALESAVGRRSGMVLMAGTGTLAIGRDARGKVHRVGGWGWQFGDEGSGYALARAALSAISRAADTRGPDTRLTADLMRERGVGTVEELLAWARSETPDQIAALAPIVCQAAIGGDPVAQVLVEAAARELAHHVEALAARLAIQSPSVALSGGLLQAGSPVRSALVALSSRRKPPIKITEAKVDPAAAALALASRL